jgi:Txe/YoeB family toxin of Txe-Axe toxin-antitoxin module
VRLAFSERAWAQYLYWQENDRKLLLRLIKECMRTPFSGRGSQSPCVVSWPATGLDGSISNIGSSTPSPPTR